MLDLIWNAVFNDKSNLEQYDESGKENLFKKVLDNESNLVRFWLNNRHSGVCYGVDLLNGCILIGSDNQLRLKPRADMLRKNSYQYRLIYFREVERNFNNSMQEIGSPDIKYYLGFQYTDENKKNHKRIAKIHKDGRMIIN